MQIISTKILTATVDIKSQYQVIFKTTDSHPPLPPVHQMTVMFLSLHIVIH